MPCSFLDTCTTAICTILNACFIENPIHHVLTTSHPPLCREDARFVYKRASSTNKQVTLIWQVAVIVHLQLALYPTCTAHRIHSSRLLLRHYSTCGIRTTRCANSALRPTTSSLWHRPVSVCGKASSCQTRLSQCCRVFGLF